MPKKDITNQVFGKLTVIKESSQRASNGSILWECSCECGNIVLSTGSDLRSGRRVSCGKCPKYENLLGQTFNKLTVIADAHKKINEKEVWICQCECGNITEVHSANLKNGSVKSCGCLSIGGDPDLTGKRFGKLIVRERIQGSSTRQVLHQWKCDCDCGNTIILSTSRLKSGQIHSCGCLSISVGELKIAQFLIEHNIPFETQKTFPTAKYPVSKMPMRFDFYLPNQNLLIEYDGLQHFQNIDFFGGEDAFKKQQENDLFKNKWCLMNGIQLERIPYTKNNEEIIAVLTRCTEVK